MKKTILIAFLTIILGLYTTLQADALIKIDPESIKISIKYGLDNKYATYQDFLGPNWMEGEDGMILTIYSPFMQLASKARSQNVPGSSEDDIKLVKKRLGRQLNQITTRNDVRFIIQIFGDEKSFGDNYDATVEEYREEPKNDGKTEAKKDEKVFFFFKKNNKPKTVSPKGYEKQAVADMDNYNPIHPFTATNSYNFAFDSIDKFSKFYLVVKGPKDKEYRFLIDKNVIY